MMESAVCVAVDLSNPGQFFASCGLLEYAHRWWGGAEGWFSAGYFFLRPLATLDSKPMALSDLLGAIATAPLTQLDPEDDYSSPIEVGGPFELRLDWWNEEDRGKRLKPWAGSMRGFRIARAMQSAIEAEEFQSNRLFDVARIAYDPREPEKKVEPFYFDARRGSTARPLDIGFSPDSLQLTSLAYPAVEFLCLSGLQRFRPGLTRNPRVFEYFAWSRPLAACVAPMAACGVLGQDNARGFRFESAFRTDQKKHKGFTTATPFARAIA